MAKGLTRIVRRVVPTHAMMCAMRMLAAAISLGAAVTVTAGPQDQAALAAVLQRAGERVERYFARAQSIVCLEVVRLVPVDALSASDGLARTVESELRLSWAPATDGTPATEAQTLRLLLRVNGAKPRANDWRSCTAPEQQTEETQPLSLLLPSQRADYEFTLAGETKVDRRPAVMVDYRLLKKVSVETSMVEGRDDCVSFDLEGGMRGRLWIDLDTFDVLRLDERLNGMIDIPLPRAATRAAGSPTSWTLERWDTSIRFKPVSFTNPDETLVLPQTKTSFRITRGSGTPRLRTQTDYTKYQRFLTGGRVVGE
jgi:hypothetical protein